TSRAEHRLLLREDNADERLTPIGRSLGLVDDERWAAFSLRKRAVDGELERLQKTTIAPTAAIDDKLRQMGTTPLRKPITLLELLGRREINYAALQHNLGGVEDAGVAERVEIRVKYQGYVTRQTEEAERLRPLEELALPADLDYARLGGLSREV